MKTLKLLKVKLYKLLLQKLHKFEIKFNILKKWKVLWVAY